MVVNIGCYAEEKLRGNCMNALVWCNVKVCPGSITFVMLFIPVYSLQARIKHRQTKEERLATVMAGREDRSFMARSALKQKKVM